MGTEMENFFGKNDWSQVKIGWLTLFNSMFIKYSDPVLCTRAGKQYNAAGPAGQLLRV